MNKKNYKYFFKILISNFLFLLITFNQNAISKPIPPGSGEGDVPANILILLDSSASMKRKIITGDGIENPGDIIELSDGNIVIGEGNLGFAKINSDDKSVDTSFSNNTRNFRGLWNDTRTVNGTGSTTDSSQAQRFGQSHKISEPGASSVRDTATKYLFVGARDEGIGWADCLII